MNGGRIKVRDSNWNRQLLESQRNYYQKLAMNSNAYDYELEALNSLLNNTAEPFNEKVDFKVFMADEQCVFKENENFFQDITNFSKLKSSLPTLDERYYLDLKIHDDDINFFVNEVFKVFGKKYSKAFDKVYRERKNNLRISNKRSFNIYLPQLRYSYINIKRENSIEDFYNFVHEYAHAVMDNLFYENGYQSVYQIVETFPILVELIASKLLDELFTDLSEEIILYQNYLARYVLNFAKEIQVTSSILPNIRNCYNFETAKRTLRRDKRFSNYNLNKLINTSNYERHIYVIAYLIAVELRQLFYDDKDKCLYTIQQIGKMHDVNECSNDIKKLGLKLNSHVPSYFNSLK